MQEPEAIPVDDQDQDDTVEDEQNPLPTPHTDEPSDVAQKTPVGRKKRKGSPDRSVEKSTKKSKGMKGRAKQSNAPPSDVRAHMNVDEGNVGKRKRQ